MSDSRDVSGVRHTYHDGHYHRDRTGRFAAAGLAAGGFAAAGGSGTLAGIAHGERKRVGRRGDRLFEAYQASKDGNARRQLHHQLAGLAGEERALGRGVKVLGTTAAVSAAAGTAGLLLHGRQHQVAKFLDGAKRRIDALPDITPKQARHAGTFGQIGAGAGVVAGASVGAAIGAAAKKPAQGAGIGGALGGAVGGAAGATAGLYHARPRRKPSLKGTAPKSTELSKAHDKTKGALAGAAAGTGASFALQGGARSAANRLAEHAADPVKQFVSPARPRPSTRPATLAEYKGTMSRSRMLGRTAEFHGSVKGRTAVIAGSAAAGAAWMNHRAKKQAALAPVAKMDDDTKTKLARGGLIGAQVADVAALKSAWHETSTATKEGTGVKSALSYGAKKAALPIVAGGLVASVGAERVMHSQQKKLQAAQTAGLKPRKRTTNP